MAGAYRVGAEGDNSMMALGLVETMGLLAAVEAADAMLKTADVRLLEKNLVGGGLVTITVCGSVSAVQVAVEAAAQAVHRISAAVLVSAHVIPRPDAEVAGILTLVPAADASQTANSDISSGTGGSTASPHRHAAAPAPAGAVTEEPEVEGGLKPAHPSSASDGPTPVTPPATETVRYDAAQLKKMSVNRLRQIARSLSGIAMTKEEIKMALKKDLLEAISNVYMQMEE